MKKNNYYLSEDIKTLLKKQSILKLSFINLNPNTKYWTKKIIKLILSMIFIIWAVFTLIFLLINLIPGDPKIINDLIAAKADPAVIAIMRDMFNLNDPFIVRYFKSIGDLFNGTMGISGTYGVPVSEILFEKLSLSFQIGFIAIAFSILIGIPTGIALARRKSFTSDLMSGVIAILAFSIPSFVIGIIFMYVSFLLGLPIIFEYGNWYTILLPAFVISIPVGLTYARYLRSSVREEYLKQYASLARVKGASEKRLLWSHILKPSLYPIIVYFPIIVTSVLFGSITIETIFSIPGAGDLMVNSSIEKDQSMLLALSVVYTFMIILAFFVRDLLIPMIDPRVRSEK